MFYLIYFFISLILICNTVNSNEKPPKLSWLCANKECDVALSSIVTKGKNIVTDHSLKITTVSNTVGQAYKKPNDGNEYWYVEVDGKKGYLHDQYIREEKILSKDKVIVTEDNPFIAAPEEVKNPSQPTLNDGTAIKNNPSKPDTTKSLEASNNPSNEKLHSQPEPSIPESAPSDNADNANHSGKNSDTSSNSGYTSNLNDSSRVESKIEPQGSDKSVETVATTVSNPSDKLASDKGTTIADNTVKLESSLGGYNSYTSPDIFYSQSSVDVKRNNMDSYKNENYVTKGHIEVVDGLEDKVPYSSSATSNKGDQTDSNNAHNKHNYNTNVHTENTQHVGAQNKITGSANHRELVNVKADNASVEEDFPKNHTVENTSQAENQNSTGPLNNPTAENVPQTETQNIHSTETGSNQYSKTINTSQAESQNSTDPLYNPTGENIPQTETQNIHSTETGSSQYSTTGNTSHVETQNTTEAGSINNPIAENIPQTETQNINSTGTGSPQDSTTGNTSHVESQNTTEAGSLNNPKRENIPQTETQNIHSTETGSPQDSTTGNTSHVESQNTTEAGSHNNPTGEISSQTETQNIHSADSGSPQYSTTEHTSHVENATEAGSFNNLVTENISQTETQNIDSAEIGSQQDFTAKNTLTTDTSAINNNKPPANIPFDENIVRNTNDWTSDNGLTPKLSDNSPDPISSEAGDVDSESKYDSVTTSAHRYTDEETPHSTHNDNIVQDNPKKVSNDFSSVESTETLTHTSDTKTGLIQDDTSFYSSVSTMFSSLMELYKKSELPNEHEPSAISQNDDSGDVKDDVPRTSTAPHGYCYEDGTCGGLERPIGVEDRSSSTPNQHYEQVYRNPVSLSFNSILYISITSFVVLLFSLGYYYIDKSQNSSMLIVKVNKLSQELFVTKKERDTLEDQILKIKENCNIMDSSKLKQDSKLSSLQNAFKESEESRAQLEETVVRLEKEVETLMENGMEMHKLLSDTISEEERSQMLLANIDELKESLSDKLNEIVTLTNQLDKKNEEIQLTQMDMRNANERALELERKLESCKSVTEDSFTKKLQDHKQQIIKLQQVLEEKRVNVAKLESELAKIKGERDSAESRASSAETGLQAAHSVGAGEARQAWLDSTAVRAALHTANQANQTLQTNIAELNHNNKLMQVKIDSLNDEISNMNCKYEDVEREKVNALTKLQVLSDYFKEKESKLQEELGMKESLWLQKETEDHTIYEQMKSLREEISSYRSQNDKLKAEILEQEASYKVQIANEEQKTYENWVALRQAERKVKDLQMESSLFRNRLTQLETANHQSAVESHNPNGLEKGSFSMVGAPSPPFMMHPPQDFFPLPPPPLHPTASRPPPLGRISSPQLSGEMLPPPPLAPFEMYPSGPSSTPPPPLPLYKPHPRERPSSKDSPPLNYSSESVNEKPPRRRRR